MKRSTQIRLTRELAASLLNSSLTERELADLCHDILSNGNIMREVSDRLLSFIEPQGRGPVARTTYYPEHVQQEAKNANIWLKNKGITKAKIFLAFKIVRPEMDEFIHMANPTIKEVMEFFINLVSQNEFHHFMNSFDDDEFIKMIEEQ